MVSLSLTADNTTDKQIALGKTAKIIFIRLTQQKYLQCC